VRGDWPKADRRPAGRIRIDWADRHRPSRATRPQQLDGGGGGEVARRRSCSPWSSPATARRAPRCPLAPLPAARIESEGYPARRADPCIRTCPWTSAPQPCSARLPRRPTESAQVDAPALLRRRPRRRRRVVLLEVEHAACKNSRVRWAFQLDLEWHYNTDTTGISAEHTQSVFQLECD
jgi:hypothetical protein